MSCYKPIKVKSYPDGRVPCGQCFGCRISHARDWGVRMVHESQLHPGKSMFLTLTYRPECLPETLEPDAPSAFMKRLRDRIDRPGVKFFCSGEYGEKFSRPHYHICIIGYWPDDAKVYKNGKFPLFTSRLIEDCWGQGFAPFGLLSLEGAMYTARYILKKVNGKRKEKHYSAHFDEDFNFWPAQVPEFARMSNQGGLGRAWIEKYLSDVYPSDEVLINGRKMRPPRFYDKVLETVDPDMYAAVKAARKESAVDKTQDQLDAELAFAMKRFAMFTKRHMEV